MVLEKNYKHKPKYCERCIRESLNRVFLDIAYNTSRKSLSDMKAYDTGFDKSQLLIEKFVKKRKYHRNILDQDIKFINDLKMKREENMKEIEREMITIK